MIVNKSISSGYPSAPKKDPIRFEAEKDGIKFKLDVEDYGYGYSPLIICISLVDDLGSTAQDIYISKPSVEPNNFLSTRLRRLVVEFSEKVIAEIALLNKKSDDGNLTTEEN